MVRRPHRKQRRTHHGTSLWEFTTLQRVCSRLPFWNFLEEGIWFLIRLRRTVSFQKLNMAGTKDGISVEVCTNMWRYRAYWIEGLCSITRLKPQTYMYTWQKYADGLWGKREWSSASCWYKRKGIKLELLHYFKVRKWLLYWEKKHLRCLQIQIFPKYNPSNFFARARLV